MKYKCNLCGRQFDRYKKYVENGEKWAVCPFCCDADIVVTEDEKSPKRHKLIIKI